MKFRGIIAISAASALALTLGITPAQATGKQHSGSSPVNNVKTIAEGLGGPLRVTFGDRGNLIIAESFAGQISTISSTGKRSVLVSSPGMELGGVSYAQGTTYYFENSMSEGAEPGPYATATLKSISAKGKVKSITDLAKFEAKHNPDAKTVYGVRDASKACLAQAPYLQSSGEVYSHPFSSNPDRSGVYVGDAGANSILHVNQSGKVSLVKVLPAEPALITEEVQALGAEIGLVIPDCMLGLNYWAQAVPTDITVKGHWLYYTVLPGVPGESLGLGKVYKLNLKTKKTQLVAQNLHAPTGIALDARGNVYVAELFGGGVSKISRGKATTVLPAVMASDVAISGKRIAVTTEALMPMGKLVTGSLRR